MPTTSSYGNVQFALDGCTDLGPPWGSTPAPAAPVPMPVPVPAPTAAPKVTIDGPQRCTWWKSSLFRACLPCMLSGSSTVLHCTMTDERTRQQT